MLRNSRYETYGFSCNPYVSIFLSPAIDNLRRFDAQGDVTEISPYLRRNESKFAIAAQMMRQGKLGLLAKLLARKSRLRKRIGKSMGTHPLEKGSRSCLNALRKTGLSEPSFVFINLMESHEPYNWSDTATETVLSKFYSIIGRPYFLNLNWRERYPTHAALAVSRAIAITRAMRSVYDRTLIIVTSDHGQMLGEEGKYGHGFFLDDQVLRVPLYIKYPANFTPFVQQEKFVSLAAVPSIIKAVTEDKSMRIGSEAAVAESFDLDQITPQQVQLMQSMAQTEDEMKKLGESRAHRVKIYTEKGTAIYNKSNDSVENLTGSMTKAEARPYADELPTIPPSAMPGEGQHREILSKKDEEIIRDQLRELGYE
jgi:hypothetical protein